jgi:hypothetical protein
VIRLDSFLDIQVQSLRKRGEELCGDTVKILRTEPRTIVVLSDGLGSGVKANILATLTAEILLKMIEEDVPLKDVLETVLGTLPICKVRKLAYATFTVVRIDHRDNAFRIINFDNPPPFYFRNGRLTPLAIHDERILDRRIQFSEGVLELGDFLGIVSDGVLHAGLGTEMSFGWGWDSIARYIEQRILLQGRDVRRVVGQVMAETNRLYHNEPGDDATFLGLGARRRNSTLIFTGPPLNKEQDEVYVKRLLSFNGRTIICGGTTANIVAEYLGEPVRIDVSTLRKDVPPIGDLSQVDLVTEGILTMSRALEYLKEADGDITRLPRDRNGARLLAEEILKADLVYFLVGQRINEFYQNPLLPKNISIRRSLVEELVAFLRTKNKEVTVEYC